MLKKHVSSVEVTALVQELQLLIPGKLSQTYDYGENGLLFQLHVRGEGKRFLRVIPGKFLNLTTKQDVPPTPSSFCLQLRKYLDNASITEIRQHQAERIILFHLQKEQGFFLIIELFAKGNIILTDESLQILGVREQQLMKERTIRPGEPYHYPAPLANWKTITGDELHALLQNSEKRSLAISLATELGVGGTFAEELCREAELDKNLLPKDIGQEQVKYLWLALDHLRVTLRTPKGYIYEDELSPIPLGQKHLLQELLSYNTALDTVSLQEKISPYEKKIEALRKLVAQQEETITALQKKSELHARRGEWVYEHYSEVQQILENAREIRRNGTWEQVAQHLQQDQRVKKVDLKEKKITIEL